MKKKLIAGALALSMCLASASCNNPDFEDSTVIDPSGSTTTTASADMTTETDAPIVETTTADEIVNPIPTVEVYDLERVQVSKHITFVYNAASADVKWDVQKGVGSRESVTFTVTMRNGYLFDGDPVKLRAALGF